MKRYLVKYKDFGKNTQTVIKEATSKEQARTLTYQANRPCSISSVMEIK